MLALYVDNLLGMQDTAVVELTFSVRLHFAAPLAYVSVGQSCNWASRYAGSAGSCIFAWDACPYQLILEVGRMHFYCFER